MAVDIAKYPLLFVPGLPRVTDLVQRALKLVQPDTPEAGNLLARYGLLLNLGAGDYQSANEAFSEALVVARREGDELLEMRTLAASADADWYQLRSSDVLRKSMRAIELSRRLDDPYCEASVLFLATHELIATGDPGKAREHALEMMARAERLRDRGLLTLACLANVNACRLKGEWSSARDFSDRGLGLDPRHSWLLGVRAVMEYETGDWAQGEAYIARLVDVMRTTASGPTAEYAFPAMAIPMVGRITGGMDRFDIAEEAAQKVLSSPSCTPRMASFRFGFALIPLQRKDVTAARRLYSDLSELREDLAAGEPMIGAMPCGDRVRGLLAANIGQIEKGIVHFEDALAFCQKAGYRPEFGWTCFDYAETLLRHEKPDDRVRAISLLDEALAVSRDLGMRPLAERVAGLQEEVQSGMSQ